MEAARRAGGHEAIHARNSTKTAANGVLGICPPNIELPPAGPDLAGKAWPGWRDAAIGELIGSAGLFVSRDWIETKDQGTKSRSNEGKEQRNMYHPGTVLPRPVHC
jgi:hypothetical protein